MYYHERRVREHDGWALEASGSGVTLPLPMPPQSAAPAGRLAASTELHRRRYRARRQLLIYRGVWNPFTDAGPVRDHVRAVLGVTGMSARQFAESAGLSVDTVRDIVWRNPGKVRNDTAVKAFRVTSPAGDPAGYVFAAGTMRRLQALACIGWPVKTIADQIGIARPYHLQEVRDGKREHCTVRTARRVSDIYDRLWNTPPAVTGAAKTAATKTRRMAEAAGWAPPAAWGDDIDDPAAQPHWDWVRQPDESRGRRGYRKPGAAAEVAEDLRDLIGHGESTETAARRLAISWAYARQLLSAFPALEEER